MSLILTHKTAGLRSIGVWLWLLTASAVAQNVDLSTVPPRDTVQLTIYNSADLTLVRETRTLSVKPGINPLQFSWANTLIDPTSVELRFVNHAAELTVLDARFPHDKPQMLYWDVQSQFEGAATVEISYFTSGIRWTADYTAIADQTEKMLTLDSFVRVYNNAGEDYERAQVRLVVGTINLVEEIATLARAREQQQLPASLSKEDYRQANKQAMRRLEARDEMMTAGAVMEAPAVAMPAPKAVAKESLSEYFLYTIEGTETIPNGWSKRLRSFKVSEIPIQVEYRYRPVEYGDQLVRLYLLRNDKLSKLGSTPLPDGGLRVFRDNGRDGLSYLATQTLQYVPIGDKIELNLGADPEVIFELVKQKVWRDNLLMQLRGANVYQKLSSGMQFEVDSQVAGWDEHALYNQRISNYSKQPITVEIRRSYSGDVLFRSKLEPVLHDFQTVQYRAVLAAGEKKNLYHEIVERQGKNAKKHNIEILNTVVTAP